MCANINVLIVEDDPDINGLLYRLLQAEGYVCRQAYSGTEAELLAAQYEYDVILLDLMIPGITGEELIKRLRCGKSAPIIVLSAKASVEDRIAVLKLGADDYITKPFDTREVLARVQAQLRRAQIGSYGPRNLLTYGELVLNREEHTATLGEYPLNLTAREFDILAMFMENPKRVFTREQIYARIWNEPYYGEDNTVNVHISNLRSKLNKLMLDAEYIRTIWGIGFKLVD